MRMRERRIGAFIGIFLIFSVFCSTPRIVSAREGVHQEIIFLLDCSYSMNETDPERSAPDCIAGLLAALPSDCSAAFIAYDDALQRVLPLDSGSDALRGALAAARYAGYTNAGEALEQAMRLFSTDAGIERSVVIFSDGEIMLEDEAQTAASQEKFARAARAARESGVRIYTVALGGRGRAPQSNIYDYAGADAVILEAADAAQLIEAGRKILFEGLGVQKIAVNSGALTRDTLPIRIPLARAELADCAKLLLTSSDPLGRVAAAYSAERGEVIGGERFAAVELTRPSGNTIELRLEAAANGRLQADLILEMAAAYETQVHAATTKNGDGAAAADIEIIPVAAAGGGRLLDDPYFSGKTVRITAEGTSQTARIEQGAIRFSLPAAEPRRVEVGIDYSGLGVNVIAPGSVFVELAPPRDYAKVVGIAAALAALFGAALWRRARAPSPPLPAPPPAGVYDYAGRLKLYLTQSPDGSDIEPLTYNLYRRFNREEITLGAVLDSCGLSFALPGAYKLFFSPGANKALILTNRSDCTVLKNKDLLVKGHSCLVYFNERLCITFEDEHSEMILEYKNVKPSERH